METSAASAGGHVHTPVWTGMSARAFGETGKEQRVILISLDWISVPLFLSPLRHVTLSETSASLLRFQPAFFAVEDYFLTFNFMPSDMRSVP